VSNVAVNQLITRGLPAGKIVVGKPATLGDDSSRVQFITASNLAQGVVAHYNTHRQVVGILLW